MSKIFITTETPADIPADVAEKNGIKTIPLHVILNGVDGLDGVTVTRDDIYKNFEENKTLPSTSAVSVAEYTDFFSALTADGGSVVHISLSAELSSTCQNARIAAQECERVFVVDSRQLSSGIALLTLRAARMRDEGLKAETIAEKIKELTSKCNVSFVLDTLEYMRKGGRCSSVAALGANLLGIKPSLEMRDGKLTVCKKYRGKIERVQEQYVEERLAGANPETDTAFLTHSGMPAEQVAKLRRIVEKKGFKNVLEGQAGCTIATHCGANCVGVLFIEK